MAIQPDPWNLYLQVDATIKQEINGKFGRHELNCALQRLCQAVLIKHSLKKEGYPKVFYHNRSLDVNAIKRLDLSSVPAMVNARVVEWEEAREEESFYDSDGPGGYQRSITVIPAAYRPQKSIQDCLKDENKDYFEVAARLNITAERALSLYNTIDRCARNEMQRIARCTITFNKNGEIDLALQRLRLAVFQKYNQQRPQGITIRIDTSKVTGLELYSINSMLDAKVFVRNNGRSNPCMSLRQVLNISRLNPLNIFSYQEAYWGKAASLESFERAVARELQPIN